MITEVDIDRVQLIKPVDTFMSPNMSKIYDVVGRIRLQEPHWPVLCLRPAVWCSSRPKRVSTISNRLAFIQWWERGVVTPAACRHNEVIRTR